MIEITIDGRKYSAEEGEMILDVTRRNDIYIPTLCYHDALDGYGACRMCMVEITKPSWNGSTKLVTACLYPVEPDLIVSTNSEEVFKVRSTVIDLLLARTPNSEVIRQMAAEYGIEKTSYRTLERSDNCILCGLCVRLCEHQGTAAIAMMNRGVEKVVSTPFDEPSPDCIGCMVCAQNCPTNAIKFEVTQGTVKIWNNEFERIKCPVCGTPHITVAQAHYYARKSGLPVEYFEKCDECKRKETVQKFSDLLVE